MDDDTPPNHQPQNRTSAESKLRRSRKHCPVCIAPLPKNAHRTKLQRACGACRANPQPGKTCRRCRAENIWQARGEAACQACGLHGTVADVIS